MKQISLTKGFVALVDDEDFEYLNQFKWHYSSGYATRNLIKSEFFNGKRKSIKMHHVIAGKAPKGLVPDHIDGNSLNNQKSNIRFVTQHINVLNSGLQKNSSSGYKGVSWHKANEKWTARISFNYKTMNIGSFDSKEEAAKAYNEAALTFHGKEAKLNKIV